MGVGSVTMAMHYLPHPPTARGIGDIGEKDVLLRGLEVPPKHDDLDVSEAFLVF